MLNIQEPNNELKNKGTFHVKIFEKYKENVASLQLKLHFIIDTFCICAFTKLCIEI